MIWFLFLFLIMSSTPVLRMKKKTIHIVDFQSGNLFNGKETPGLAVKGRKKGYNGYILRSVTIHLKTVFLIPFQRLDDYVYDEKKKSKKVDLSNGF